MNAKDSRKNIRKENLRTIVGWKEVGTASNLAKLADTNASYLSQILSKKAVRSVGDSLAENIEKALNLPKGWMDTPHQGEGDKTPETAINEPGEASSGSVQPTQAKPRITNNEFIPVLGTTSKGPVDSWDNSRERLRSADQVLMVQMNDPYAYALLCLQDIRQMGARAGSAILIEPSITPVTGDDVFMVLNSGETLICRLAGQLGGNYLVTDAGEFEGEEISKADVKCMHWIAGVMSKRVIEDRIVSQELETSTVDDRHHAMNQR